MLEAGFKSWIGFPVVAEGEAIAVIEFFDTELRPRDERMLQLISTLANQLGPVIERKRAAEQIDILNASLQRHTVELEATNKELESFSYSVSHDLRAPLRAVDGYARMLEEDYRERLDDEGRRLLGVVREASSRMGRLIDDLLAFSRLGRQEPASAAASTWRSWSREVVGGGARRVAGGHRARRAAGAPTPTRAMLKQVWVNLIGNALKYSGKRADAAIEIGGREDGGEAGLLGARQRRRLRHALRDEAVRRVPAPAPRRGVSRHRRRPGDRAARRHAPRRPRLGREQARRGRVLLFFAAAEARMSDLAAGRDPAGRGQPRGRGNDDARAAQAQPRQPAALGEGRRGGARLPVLYRALRRPRPNAPPRLVLLDIKMPKVDGIEVLRRVKASDAARTVPVVVMTSSNEERDVLESYRLGVNSYIVKPVQFEAFIETVAKIGLYWVLTNRVPRMTA